VRVRMRVRALFFTLLSLPLVFPLPVLSHTHSLTLFVSFSQLTVWELEPFFEEQRQRIQTLAQEPIHFADVLCQL